MQPLYCVWKFWAGSSGNHLAVWWLWGLFLKRVRLTRVPNAPCQATDDLYRYLTRPGTAVQLRQLTPLRLTHGTPQTAATPVRGRCSGGRSRSVGLNVLPLIYSFVASIQWNHQLM